jgi:hypothetical protein
MSDIPALRKKFRAVLPALDERTRRLWAGAEARSLGRGGISAVAEATGMSRDTVRRGACELGRKPDAGPGRIRRAGAGRKREVDLDPELRPALLRLVDPVTRGDPQSSLRWTSARRQPERGTTTTRTVQLFGGFRGGVRPP